MSERISFTVNGAKRTLSAEPDTALVHVLRQELALTGTHLGCGLNQCGACNVLVDDIVTASCDTPLWSVAGKHITTVEGLGNRDAPHALQTALIEEQAIQCGYCISGILISAAALLRKNPDPDRDQIREALDGNLCRCGAHLRIIKAIQKAAQTLRAEGAGA